jgi:lipopolysaccharide transport system ATP-binding protein
VVSTTIINVENLGKRYRIGERRNRNSTLRDALASAAQMAVCCFHDRNRKNSRNLFWALRDVSFEVNQGDVLGIIGRNGAGKSTLLKVLTRVTYPTAGRAEIRGRTGSLLEVGTGFHPELTGRENIYLNGAILGMRRTEIHQKFDEIVEFAEIEKFLDTPVKRYSSGMYMRLAFAIAAHLEPEILIVDEVLAVGDAAFQKKCLGKMGKVAKEGRTVLFVSHNMVAIQSLCNRVIWLDQGRLMAEGQPAPVVSNYLQSFASSLTQQIWGVATAPGNDNIRLRRVCVRPEDGEPSDPITMRTPVVLEFDFWNLLQGAYLDLNFQLITAQGIVVFASNPTDQTGWHGKPYPTGLFRSKCHIPGDLLKSGCYSILLTVTRDDHYILYQQENVLVFEVQDSVELRRGWYGEMVGTVRPLLKWTTERVDDHAVFTSAKDRLDRYVPEKV